MNITFLIGNGFDRNLGLLTTYSDFVDFYKTTVAKTVVLKKFREDIDRNKELWSDAEIALGQYTSQFDVGRAAAFAECQTDFCEFLSTYLKGQEERIDYDQSTDLIVTAFSQLEEIASPFPTQEQDVIKNIIKKKVNENTKFNFICFNYTSTLDNCLQIVKASTGTLGTHKYGDRIFNHAIGELCHVHGTVDKEMVFGVNDESQIAKEDIFDCDDGDIYKNLLIKVQANASYLENTDAKAKALLDNSQIIYVYGMSIGETDKLWWQRICKWLSGNPDRHLIVQKHGFPTKSVIPTNYQIAERKARREITNHSNLDQSQRNSIENRIHITGDNIFSNISEIANASSNKYERYREVLEQIKAEEILEKSKKELATV